MQGQQHLTTRQTFSAWRARYKVWQLEVFESERSDIWLALGDVRQVLPGLRKDAVLQKAYPSAVVALDKSRRLFVSEQAFTSELSRHAGPEALLLLAWFEKTVAYPARRKRAELQALPEGHPTGPAREADADRGAVALLKQIGAGQRDLMATLLLGGTLTLVYEYLLEWVVLALGNPDNYQGNYVLRIWLVFAALLAAAVGPLWWSVGTMRCALRYQSERRKLWLPLLAFVAAASLLLNAGATALGAGGEWLVGWVDLISNRNQVVSVTHDPALGRLVLRGELGFGSYKVLQKALALQPPLRLIQLESPGGFVLEGLAMAKLIQASGLDTVSLEHCASACTLLLAAGRERYLGPDAEIGFHRSGLFGKSPSTGWTPTDYRIAAYYQSRGTAQAFVEQALATPSDQIWTPDAQAMLEAGYASKIWSER